MIIIRSLAELPDDFNIRHYIDETEDMHPDEWSDNLATRSAIFTAFEGFNAETDATDILSNELGFCVRRAENDPFMNNTFMDDYYRIMGQKKPMQKVQNDEPYYTASARPLSVFDAYFIRKAAKNLPEWKRTPPPEKGCSRETFEAYKLQEEKHRPPPKVMRTPLDIYNKSLSLLGPCIPVTIDLSHDDNIIINDLRKLLKTYRPLTNIPESNPLTIPSENNINKWRKWRILAYLDLDFWAKCNNYRITSDIMGSAIFPDQANDKNIKDRIDKTIKPNAKKLLSALLQSMP